MALAGHENGIARACERDGGRDGTTAIGLHGEALGVFHTRHDIGDDGIGLLVTRVVARHHGVVGGQRRSSHDGTLGGVAVAAAAEDDDGASARELLDRGDGLGERVGGVGVIHVHRHRRVHRRAHALQAAGNRRHGCQSLGDNLGGNSQGQRAAEGRHDVLHVEAPHERVLHRDARPAHLEHRLGAGGLVGDLHRMDLGGDVEARGDDLVAGGGAAAKKLAPPGAVDGDDAAGRVVLREQKRLGLEVVVEGVVVVQVVLGEVRERRHGEVGVPGAAQIERVRAHLHGHHRAAGVAHPREQLLQVGRFRRGALGVLHDAGDLVAHGADDAAAVAGHARDVLHQIGRGGLAVGARDTHEREGPGGVVVVVRRGVGHGLARVGDDDLGDIGGVGQVHLALGHQRGGPAVDGVLGEGVAVDDGADDAEEHIVRMNLVAAERQPCHLLVPVADDSAIHPLEEL